MDIDTSKDGLRNWVKALRSGEYKQARGTMKSHDVNYCCLGVLAEINGIAPRESDPGNDEDNNHKIYELIRDALGEIMNDYIEMNDGPYSFNGIAYEIERDFNLREK